MEKIKIRPEIKTEKMQQRVHKLKRDSSGWLISLTIACKTWSRKMKNKKRGSGRGESFGVNLLHITVVGEIEYKEYTIIKGEKW